MTFKIKNLVILLFILIIFDPLYSKESEKDKNVAGNYSLVAQSYLEKGDVKASIKYIKKALSLDTENHSYQYMLAKNYLFIGDYKNAEKYLNKVWKHLASIKFFSTHYIENTSYEYQSEFYLVAYYKAILNYINKVYSTRIMIILSNEIIRNPLFPDAHYLYGCTALKGGPKDTAIKEFNKALEIDPTFTPAKEKLDEIKKKNDISQVTPCDINVLLKRVYTLSAKEIMKKDEISLKKGLVVLKNNLTKGDFRYSNQNISIKNAQLIQKFLMEQKNTEDIRLYVVPNLENHYIALFEQNKQNSTDYGIRISILKTVNGKVSQLYKSIGAGDTTIYNISVFSGEKRKLLIFEYTGIDDPEGGTPMIVELTSNGIHVYKSGVPFISSQENIFCDQKCQDNEGLRDYPVFKFAKVSYENEAYKISFYSNLIDSNGKLLKLGKKKRFLYKLSKKSFIRLIEN